MPLKGHGIQFAFAPLIYLEIFIFIFIFYVYNRSRELYWCLLFTV